MKIEKRYQIEQAVSTDAARWVLNTVHLDELNGKKVAVATDGRMMAIAPCDYEDDEKGKRVTPEALKIARKIKKQPGISDGEMSIRLNGEIKLTDGRAFPAVEVGYGCHYPNWKQVLPNDETNPVKFSIAFDPELLFSLAKALGWDGDKHCSVKMEFSDDLGPIRVSVGPEGKGVLMPMRMS